MGSVGCPPSETHADGSSKARDLEVRRLAVTAGGWARPYADDLTIRHNAEAADSSGDRSLLWRAAGRLDIGVQAGAPAARLRGHSRT